MLEVLAPTMIDFAAPELAAEMVPRLLRGDETWCQGFSEPEATTYFGRPGELGTATAVQLASLVPLPAGEAGLAYALGILTAVDTVVDGAQVAEGRIPQTVRFRFSLDETFDVGRDTGTPVIEDYALPFVFGGTLQNVNIALR